MADYNNLCRQRSKLKYTHIIKNGHIHGHKNSLHATLMRREEHKKVSDWWSATFDFSFIFQRS